MVHFVLSPLIKSDRGRGPFLFIVVLFVLAACAPSPAAPSPTSAPLNTQPPQATTLAPSPSPTPTVLPTPTEAGFFPAAPIEIRFPTEGSALLSPLGLSARLPPGQSGPLTIALHAEDGRLLARQVLILGEAADTEESLWLHSTLNFEIAGPSEPARLSLSTQDEYGRPFALSSVALTLLAPGSEESLSALDAPVFESRIWVQSLEHGQPLAPGPFEVRGLLRAETPRPLLIQVLNRAGRVLASNDVYPAEIASDFPTFSHTFDLTLDESQWLQVAVSKRTYSPDLTIHLSTLEIFYSPADDG